MTALNDHPLYQELRALQAAAIRFQEEAHTNALKLQHYALESSRVTHLERENEQLRKELSILRANPHPDDDGVATSGDPLSSAAWANSTHPAATHARELTLRMRALSQKVDETEAILQQRNVELVQAQAAATQAKLNAENAYAVGARVRGREEAGKQHISTLEWQIQRLEEEKRATSLVLGQYADLVRELEGRRRVLNDGGAGGHGSPDLPKQLEERKTETEKIMDRFQVEIQTLQADLDRVHAEKETLLSELAATQQANGQLQLELGNARTEMDRVRADDSTASKMVARYMQFSQRSTNALQTSLKSLATRHAATVDTLTTQNHSLSNQLRSAEATAAHLRRAVDGFGVETMRETLGRRREVALRMRVVTREEKLRETLARWVRKGDEIWKRVSEAQDNRDAKRAHDGLLEMIQEAKTLLARADEGVMTDRLTVSASLGRLILVESLLDGLMDDLEKETALRVTLAQENARQYPLPLSGSEKPSGRQPSSPLAFTKDPPVPPISEKASPSLVPISEPPIIIHAPIPVKSTADLVALVEESAEEASVPPTPIDASDSGVHQLEQTIERHPTPPHIPSITSAPGGSLEDIPANDPSTTEVLASSAEHVIILSPPTDTLSPLAFPADSIEPSPASSTVDLPTQEDEDSRPDNTKPALAASAVTEGLERVAPSIQLHPSPPPSSSSPASSPPPGPPISVLDPEPHPLLSRLRESGNRYEDLQRGFRNCHSALESLRESIQDLDAQPSQRIPKHFLEAVVQRLDDYMEDVRVELEIRVEDENVVRKGWEMMISLLPSPGQPIVESSSGSTPSLPGTFHDAGHGTGLASENIESQVEEYLSGSDAAFARGRSMFAKKLADVEHDIAAVKRWVYEGEFMEGGSDITSPDVDSGSTTSSSVQRSTSGTSSASANSGSAGGGGWASWIRTPSSASLVSALSRPTTPRPISPALSTGGTAKTFGDIMTSPRLARKPSTNISAAPSHHARGSISNLFLGGVSRGPRHDPAELLGLRIPMPSFASLTPAEGSPSLFSAGVGGTGLGMNSIGFGMGSPLSSGRSRAVSGLFGLGLGVGSPAPAPGRSASGAGGRTMSMVGGGRGGFIGSGNGAANTLAEKEKPSAVDTDSDDEGDDVE